MGERDRQRNGRAKVGNADVLEVLSDPDRSTTSLAAVDSKSNENGPESGPTMTSLGIGRQRRGKIDGDSILAHVGGGSRCVRGTFSPRPVKAGPMIGTDKEQQKQ